MPFTALDRFVTAGAGDSGGDCGGFRLKYDTDLGQPGLFPQALQVRLLVVAIALARRDA